MIDPEPHRRVPIEPDPGVAAAPPVPEPALEVFAARLAKRRRERGAALPDAVALEAWADDLIELLFGRATDPSDGPHAVRSALERSAQRLAGLLAPIAPSLPAAPHDVARVVLGALPAVHEALLRDAEAIEAGDPAAESVEEVVLAYPGFLALAFHRLAHVVHGAGVPLVPRILSEIAHRRTGIDIHPAASLGSPIVIDHGTGIVIGETAVLGDRVKLYQGVTLGALSVEKSFASRTRHPTIEDDVVIYANATILGGDTVVGRGSVIGGNVWLTESVPAGSVVHHRSEVRVRPARRAGEPPLDFVI